MNYFVTNARRAALGRVVAVAFRRATIEHSFRIAKSEAGLLHYEGHRWVGLVRHLILNLVVLGFVSIHTDRRRGDSPVTMEQVYRILNTRVAMTRRRKRGEVEQTGFEIRYYQARNKQATDSRKKRRRKLTI